MDTEKAKIEERSNQQCLAAISNILNTYAIFGDEVFRKFETNFTRMPLTVAYVKVSDGPTHELAYIINRINTMEEKNFLGQCNEEQKKWFLELREKTIAIAVKKENAMIIKRVSHNG